MTVRRLVAVSTLLLGTVLAACGGSDAAGDTTVSPTVGSAALPDEVATTALETTVVTTTELATTAVTTTVVATTAVSTTALTTTVPTTAAPTTAAPTTVPASTAPCDLATIVRQTDTDYEGITAVSLRCAGEWASWVGQPDDALTSDGFFAVAQWNGSTWELANLGTAGICGDGGVPAELWDALGCVE